MLKIMDCREEDFGILYNLNGQEETEIRVL